MTKEKQVTVLGAGYSGLTTAAELTLRGFEVSLLHFLPTVDHRRRNATVKVTQRNGHDSTQINIMQLTRAEPHHKTFFLHLIVVVCYRFVWLPQIWAIVLPLPLLAPNRAGEK